MTNSAWATTNYFNKKETCLKKSDIEKVQSHFYQFQDFSEHEGLVCKGVDIDAKWFEIVRTVLALQRLTVTDQLQRDLNDDFTLRPIGQKDWWGYFTDRANNFEIEPSHCSQNANIVAFVYPFFKDKIYLCSKFFEMDPGGQIEVLMHEVRHFEGFAHVKCTQGNENGSEGACDSNIKNGGSYAVSVQASVELSYVDQLRDEDRALAESSAIYSINNKFNSLPSVKSESYVYLTNQEGGLYRAPIKNLAKPEFVAQMKSPAKAYGNGSQLTLFPIDTTENAYRTSKDLKVNAPSIGAFANKYNSESEFERQLYQSANYYGIGAIVKQDTIYAFCGKGASTLSGFDFPEGSVQSMLSLKLNSAVDETFVLSTSGEVYKLNCNDMTAKLSTSAVDLALPNDTVTSFSVKQDQAYILNDSGELSEIDLKTQRVSETSLPLMNWISATPIEIYNVFEEAIE